MTYFLDTNIFISFVKNRQFRHFFKQTYSHNENGLITSVVVDGEIQSFITRHKWGFNKRRILNNIFNQTSIAPIKIKKIIERYAEIDAYSQGKHPTLKLPMSARNMGKNDIWIAATASVLGLTLITTDKDFEHLQDVFLNIDFIDIRNFI
ncbi:MAG: type II toxin-antitoxin system VapC family toxin [Saprospiraceae bacterium]